MGEGPFVLVDLRTYRVKVGTMNAQLEMYEKYGYAPQTRHLGKPYIYLYAESGALNTFVHGWLYEDAADRARRRAALAADPEWLAYIKMANEAGYIIEQSNMLMVPPKFAPIARR
jgi:hypothetical protein